jgi:hypothetical protein
MLLLLVAAPRLNAGALPRWRPRLEVLAPRRDAVAPRNTHVRLLQWAHVCDFLFDGETQMRQIAVEPEMLAIRAQDGGPIEIDRRVSPAPTTYRHRENADPHLVELIPRAPLPPSRYQVLLSTGDEVHVIATFVTDEHAATEAPAWRGVRRAELIRLTEWNYKCSPGPYIRLTIFPLSDSKASDFLFPVWLAGEEEAIDYDTPPLEYAAVSYEGRSVLSVLGVSDRIAERKSVRIGIRLLDAAGHLGPPREVALPVSHARAVKKCSWSEAETD